MTRDEMKTQLRQEYPDWSIITTDRGRWWATRGPQPGEQVNNGIAALDADSPDQLRALLIQAEGAVKPAPVVVVMPAGFTLSGPDAT